MMKKVLFLSLFVICSVGISVANWVTVIPYSIDSRTSETFILLGKRAHYWVFPHDVRIFSPNFVASLGQRLEPPTVVDFAVRVFNKKTLFSFAHAVMDTYPDSPKSSVTDPDAGYSHFIVDEPVDIAACACAEGAREWHDDEGAYGSVDVTNKSCAYARELMLGCWCNTPTVKAFDDAIRTAMLEQQRVTPVIQMGDHYYYFLLVPFISAGFLMTKRSYVQHIFPGTVGLSFGDCTPESKVSGYLGADLEAFVWVERDALVAALRLAQQKAVLSDRNHGNCVVLSASGALSMPKCLHCRLDPALVSCLSDDGVVDAIAQLGCHA